MSRKRVVATITLLIAVCTIALAPPKSSGAPQSASAAAPTPPARVPQAIADTTFYLTDSGIPVAWLDGAAPPAIPLPNYDPNRDAFPGLLIKRGGLFKESDPDRYQMWILPGVSVNLNGPVLLAGWMAVKDFADKRGVIRAYLLEYNPATGDRRSIASAEVASDTWTSTWTMRPFTFGLLSHTMTPGYVLAVQIVVPNTSDDDMLFAYGTQTEPSWIAVNNATFNIHPTLDLDADDSGVQNGTGFHVEYVERGGAVALADIDARITDPDDGFMTSLVVTINNIRDAPFERLAADVSGTSIVADFDAGLGVLTLTGTDSLARYERVLRSITYENIDDDANTIERNIGIVVSDSTGQSNEAMATVAITLANDPPAISLPKLLVSSMDTPVTFQGSNGNAIVITDPDAGFESMWGGITTTNGTLTLSSSFGLSFNQGDGDRDTLMTFLGNQYAMTSALDGAVFRPDPGFVGDARLIVAVNDQGHSGAGPAYSDFDTLTIVYTASDESVEIWTGGVFVPGLRPGYPPTEVFELSMVSHSTVPETLTTITFTNTSQGAGSQADLDQAWSQLVLSTEDGRAVSTDKGWATAKFVGGAATFSNLQPVLLPGDTLRLRVSGGASMTARDGDMLDLGILATKDLHISPPVSLDAHWPLNPGDLFPVDGMVAGQIVVHPSIPVAIQAGSLHNLALDVTLPANGYETDVLNKLNVENLGTALPGTDISAIEAWADADANRIFGSLADTRLGGFSFTGTRWELTGLSHPVPLNGLRVFFTVDIAQSATETRTLQITLPTAPDVAIGMASGNDGPIDVAVSSNVTQSITAADRIVLSSASVGDRQVAPGTDGIELFHLVATNNFATPKQITRLTFHNAIQPGGASTPQDLDDEIVVLELRMDANGNGVLDDVATDPVIGTGFFFSGSATFNNLAWNLPPATTEHVFVTGDVSPNDAADGDALAIELSGLHDVDFSDVTHVNAEWPLATNGSLVVDGMLAAQTTVFGIAPLTAAPSDGPLLAFDMLVPSNGYRDDVLESLEFINIGTAAPNDLSDVRLWRDGGDGLFSAGGGDDVEIGPLVWTGSAWQTPLLGEAVPRGGGRLFLGVTVSVTPADSVTIRMSVPVDGINMASGNDGPTDQSLTIGQGLLISSSPLLASLSVTPPVSTIGQTVTVRMVINNVGTETINTVTPSALTETGDAMVTAVSGPAPTNITLAIGAVDTFTWTYTASGAGTIQWSGWCDGTGAVSGLTRRALSVSTNNHNIFVDASEFDLFAIQSMPFFVSRGQTDVVPLSLTVVAPSDSQSSDVRLLSLKIRLESGAGSGIIPADVFGKATVSEGGAVYLAKTALETSGDEIDLTLSTPLIVRRNEPTTIALRFDVLATTTEPDFRIVINDSTWIQAEDAISSAPVVARLQEQTFPVMSGLGQIVSPPQGLDISAASGPPQRVGWGQLGVNALALQMENPGVTGVTTDIAVGEIAVGVVDTLGNPIASPADFFQRIRIIGPLGIVAERVLDASDSTMIVMQLSPLLQVPVNTPYPVDIRVDVADAAQTGAYRLRLGDSLYVDARDANSNSPVAVFYQTHPLEGPILIVEANADSVIMVGTPLFADNVSAGQTDTPTMMFTLRHPSGSGVASIRIDAIALRCQNEVRQTLAPAQVLDRVRLYRDSIVVAEEIPSGGDILTIPISGITIAPGDSVTLEMRVDILETVPSSFLEVFVESGGIVAADVNTGAAVAVYPEPGQPPVLTSGLARVSPPATELVIDFESRLPTILADGMTAVEAAVVSMTNSAPQGSGAIIVNRLAVRASDAKYATIPVGGPAHQIFAVAAGQTVGVSDTLAADSTTATIVLSPAVSIAAGETVDVTLVLDLGGTTNGGFRIGIDAGDIGVLPLDPSLPPVRIEPSPGNVFPMWTIASSFSPTTLDASYSNFPNPFAAGRNYTNFVYFLPSDGAVTLRIWTIRGEEVTTLRSNVQRAAGLHQDDRWNGKNGQGVTVVNGVYLAELVVNLANGQSQRLFRKVLVVR